MKHMKFFLIAFLLLNFVLSNAQVFYYSSGRKIYLKRDTSTIFVNLDKAKVDETFLNSLLTIEGAKSLENTSDNNVMALKLLPQASADKILSLLKNDGRIFHAWVSLSLDGVPYIATGEILLKLTAGITINDILSSLKLKTKVTIRDTIFYDTYVLSIVDPNSLFDIANSIYESKLVDWCHPNFYVPMLLNQNDPLFGQQYYLRNTGQFGGVAGIDINVLGAWGITLGSPNIRIAVIDDGVEDHEDLAGRVLNGFSPRDANGNGRPNGTGAHGEATAGIISATQDNSIGITGVAPHCQIVPINIFTGGETTLDVANGINWAWNQGQADVLSNSWGYMTSSQNQPGFDAIIQAINNARTEGRAGRGSPVVFASGNNFGNGIDDVQFPANVDGVITVGACNNAPPSGDIWYYSERGSSMDLVAPSGDINLTGDITTLDRMGALGYEAGNYTFRFGGTSAACPEVSGIAALVLSVNPNLTEAQVRSILQTSATDMGTAGFDNTFGFGRADGCASVGQALSTLSITGDVSFCSTSNNYTILNLPAGVQITWQASPQGIVNINSLNSPQTTLTRIANGTINLSAVIPIVCGGQVTITKSNISVGAPSLVGVQQYFNLSVCDDYDTYFKILHANGNYAYSGTLTAASISGGIATNYSWSLSPGYNGNNFAWYYNGATVSVSTNRLNVTLGLRCTASNSCGSTYKDFYFTTGICQPSRPETQSTFDYTIAPNPAQDYITVSVDNSVVKDNPQSVIYGIKIIDATGVLRNICEFKSGVSSTKISVVDLDAGLYLMSVFDGQQWYSKQLVIQK